MTGRDGAEGRLARLASFPELNPNPVLEVGQDGAPAYLNPAARRLFPDLRARGCEHPVLAGLVEAAGGLAEGGSVVREVGVGGARYRQVVHRAPGEEGARLYMVDVTERARAEEALKESEERFRSLVQNSSDVVTVLAADGAILYESPSVGRVLGYGPDERVGGNAFSYVHPDDLGTARAVFGEILRGAGVPQGPAELRYRHADGSWRCLEGVGNNLLSDPAVGGIVVNFRDVTGRREAEVALEESEERFRYMVQNSSDVITLVGADGAVLYVSPAVERVLGYAPEERAGGSVFDLVHPDDVAGARGLLAEGLRSPGVPLKAEVRQRHKDGSWRHVEVTGTNLLGEPSAGAVVLNSRDVTERKLAEKALKESEERHRAVVEQTAEGIFLFDPATKRLLEANPAFREILGYAPEELARMTVYDLVPHDPGSVDRNVARNLERGHLPIGERQYRRKDGSLVDLEVSGSPISYGGGEAICAVVRDVTERRRAEEDLRRSERELAEAQRIARVGSWTFDVADDRGRWSDEMYRIFGHDPQEFVVTYKRLMGLVHPEDRNLLRKAVHEALYGDEDRYGLDYRLVRPDGGVRFLHSEYEVVRDGSGRAVRLAGTSQDVTERRALEEELRRRALHDALTGLPNRVLFEERLGQALGRAGRRGTAASVLLVDLDNFKYVNDSLGHRAGDELLVAVAGRLRGCLRPGDAAARLGGDEFAVLLEGVGDRARAKRVAGRVIKGLREPFCVDGLEAFVTPSIGIALGEPGRDSAEDLLRRADVAMYRAKRGGKARHAVFDRGMEAEVVARLRLENDLRRALERGEFAVRYQPVVRLGGAGKGRPGGAGGWRVVGFEALLRWEHPERGPLGPDEFLPLAEELGLTVPVGRRVLREACLQTREWQERYPRAAPLAVGVNLSPKHLSHRDLLGDVEAAAQEAGLSPEQVTLEVTEDAVVGEARRPIGALRRLRDAGFSLALDDFGTGHSSLSHLRRLPIGLVKLDRSFVEGLGEGGPEEDEVLVSGVAGIAHGLGLLVCAEGVETRGQLARVGALGCDLAQGFLFSRPLTAGAAADLLRAGAGDDRP